MYHDGDLVILYIYITKIVIFLCESTVPKKVRDGVTRDRLRPVIRLDLYIVADFM